MYVCLLGPRNCGGDKADSRWGGSMAAQLSPDMPQPAMDQFLAAAFGVQTNPCSVKDIFESRKDAVAWGLLQRTLKLDDKQAHDLVLALRQAAASKAPAAPPQPKAAHGASPGRLQVHHVLRGRLAALRSRAGAERRGRVPLQRRPTPRREVNGALGEGPALESATAAACRAVPHKRPAGAHAVTPREQRREGRVGRHGVAQGGGVGGCSSVGLG